ncbi:MAG: methyltransferase domain-containing protein [Dehalococcoidia bacterium]|nr:methyltransferase domain-containing protein [Dehalococcoidia bacterium]
MAFWNRQSTVQVSEEKPVYTFEGSGQSAALAPAMFGLIAFMNNIGEGGWNLLPLLFILLFGLSSVTSIIGSAKWHRDGLNRLLVDSSHLGRTSKALNAVCGTGSLAVAYGKALPRGEVWATDHWKPTKRVPMPSQRTSDNIRIESVENIVRLRDANPQELPFKDGYFSAVGSRYGLQNTHKGKKDALLEMLRVLRPTGRLVLAEGLFTALWLRYQILPRLARELRVSDIALSRFHFTFIVTAQKLG